MISLESESTVGQPLAIRIARRRRRNRVGQRLRGVREPPECSIDRDLSSLLARRNLGATPYSLAYAPPAVQDFMIRQSRWPEPLWRKFPFNGENLWTGQKRARVPVSPSRKARDVSLITLRCRKATDVSSHISVANHLPI